MNQFFNELGYVGTVLFLLGIFVLTIIILKLLQFYKMGVWSNYKIGLNNGFSVQKLEKTVATFPDSRNPVLLIGHELIKYKSADERLITNIESSVTTIGNQSIQKLEQLMRPLEVLSHLAPLIGLLGTVLGIITAFSAIKSASYVDPGLLSSGISHALITTALGLSVAIPAQVGFHYFDSQIDKLRNQMNYIVSSYLATLK